MAFVLPIHLVGSFLFGSVFLEVILVPLGLVLRCFPKSKAAGQLMFMVSGFSFLSSLLLWGLAELTFSASIRQLMFDKHYGYFLYALGALMGAYPGTILSRIDSKRLRVFIVAGYATLSFLVGAILLYLFNQ